MLDSVLKLGWRLVEAAVLLVIVCVILNIILGSSSGPFIGSVAANTNSFIREIPPGTFLGVMLIVGLYWVLKARTRP
jgi:phosphoglycerol transferase MdoB-like AlkP superfamily enzyme